MMAATPNLINWPLQRSKMWHDNGHLPTWTELRRVADASLEESLKGWTLLELADLVRPACRNAGLKAAQDKWDKNAQLRRDYYNIVMDILEAELKAHAEEMNKNNAGCGRAEAGVEELTEGEKDSLPLDSQKEHQPQNSQSQPPRGRTEQPPRASDHNAGPRQTTFFPGLLHKGLVKPTTYVFPNPETEGEVSMKPAESKETQVHQATDSGQQRDTAINNTEDLKEWVNVEDDLVSEWVSIIFREQ
ncbi:hypothetical protein VTI74DRAFT_6568 [Chaetomium olivicolor]